MGGYPVVLGQNQSGDEELVETWPSALVTEEEVAQYINADTLLGLNPATVPGFNGGAHPQLDIWDVNVQTCTNLSEVVDDNKRTMSITSVGLGTTI